MLSERVATVRLRELHQKQRAIKNSRAKRKIVRAGRRGGKTTVEADEAVEAYLAGRRVLYAVPTQDQVDRFWFECKRALREPLKMGVYYKNETRHIIEVPDTENRIRAKTAYNADTLRGDYGDLIILDEFQDMDPDALEDVVYPMLLDNDGDLMVTYTSRRVNKGGRGLKKAHELFRRAELDRSGRWEAFTFTSLDNPYLSETALREITKDMTPQAYKAEIMALELSDDPEALWNRDMIEAGRVLAPPDLERLVIGVDPAGSVNTETGILLVGMRREGREKHYYVLADHSKKGKPDSWGSEVITVYRTRQADRVIGEVNYGGDMVENTINAIVRSDQDKTPVPFKAVRASRGKAVRAEPISALYGGINPDGSLKPPVVHHVGELPELEDEQCQWAPGKGMPSPNRLDALVWAIWYLMQGGQPLPEKQPAHKSKFYEPPPKSGSRWRL